MKKIKFVLSFLVLSLLFNCFGCANIATPPNTSTFTAEQIYNIAKDSTVEIITYDSLGHSLALGSGFVYSKDGKIITNYHVIDGAWSANVYIGETSYPVVSVLSYDVDIDLAVLKISANNLKALKISTTTANTGSTIYALGSSRGLTSTFSKGIITTSERELDGVKYVQHDAAISSGNSGGPLLNEKCEVIGINTLTIKESQNLNFAISVTELGNLIYDTPQTLSQVYEKENDGFTKLSNYIMLNGELENGEYFYGAGSSYTSDGTIYTRGSWYTPSTQKLKLGILFDDLLFVISFYKGDSVYSYTFQDVTYDYYCLGNFYPATFSSSTTYLYYTSTNITNNSLALSFLELGSSLAKLLITTIQSDYAEIGLEAYQLGFVNF